MTMEVISFRGADMRSHTEGERGKYEPETDPRDEEPNTGNHLMEAVQAIPDAQGTTVAYLDPVAAEQLQEATESAGEGSDIPPETRLMRLMEEHGVENVITLTDRFQALVNPERAEHKRDEKFDTDPSSDHDLWHVPTKNYNVQNPVSLFQPLAAAIRDHDDIDPEGVYGEFRLTRAGGRVNGNIFFDQDDMVAASVEGEPVHIGLKFGYDFFGSQAFSIQPIAQMSGCKNSIRGLEAKESIMHHRKNPDLQAVWESKIDSLALVGEDLAHIVEEAKEVTVDFTDLPMTIEQWYSYAGLPDRAVGEAGSHARQRARDADDETEDEVSMFSLYNGATYWLTWFWDGSESSRSFRDYRRASEDILMNPNETVSRVQDAYEQEQLEREAEEREGVSVADLTVEDIDHEGVAKVDDQFSELQDRVAEVSDAQERLDRIEENMGIGAEQ